MELVKSLNEGTINMKIGLVTCKQFPKLTASENLLIPLYATKGMTAEPLVWDDPCIRWQDYSFLIFRSMWDSHIEPNTFRLWLDHLEELGIKTYNPITVVKQNLHKFYLRDLLLKGIRIIPTIFIERSDYLDLTGIKDTGWDRAVIKPAISANSFFTEELLISDYKHIADRYRGLARERDLLLQEFMPEIQSSGELSMIFFNREFSHAVLKVVHEDDFRVQEKYGGKAFPVRTEHRHIETAKNILTHFQGDILYARVDGVIRDGDFYLMEIELTEPELYFDYFENARQHFVEATVKLAS